jgi:tRNA/rRNA methyltransferase
MLEQIDVILHRPQSSENIGAVARAMKNFGLMNLVMVSPLRYEASRARTLAVHAGEILHNARLALTLDDAIAPYAFVIPTTERAIIGRELPVVPREAARRLIEGTRTGRVALLFGEEASGLSTHVLARFSCYSSIPSNPDRRSLNLAQAVLLYAWELYQESGEAKLPDRPDDEKPVETPAPLQLITLLRENAKRLLLGAGFLNVQQPDRHLDELIRLLQRARPTQREVEMLLAAVAQLERTSAVAPR